MKPENEGENTGAVLNQIEENDSNSRPNVLPEGELIDPLERNNSKRKSTAAERRKLMKKQVSLPPLMANGLQPHAFSAMTHGKDTNKEGKFMDLEGTLNPAKGNCSHNQKNQLFDTPGTQGGGSGMAGDYKQCKLKSLSNWVADDTRKSLASKVINSEGNEYTDSEHNKSCNSEQKRSLEQKKIDLKKKMINHSVTAIYRKKTRKVPRKFRASSISPFYL